MHECLLCKRDMKNSKDTFGNSCIRNIYSFLGISMPKKVKLREATLCNNIMKRNNIRNINTYQKMWLTDRYLTQQYLNKVPYGNYSRLTNQINTEIQNINKLKNKEKPKSSKNMSLKQAYDLYKKSTNFTEGIENINNIIKEYGKSNEEFIFDIPYNKEFSMTFSESDLYFSLNNVCLYLKAKKENKKWNLEINLHDK